MPSTLRFQVELHSGLHARPASMIADTVRRFHADARLTNLLSGESADARSVLSMIGLDVQRGHAVLLEAGGDDEAELIAAVRVLVHERFGEHPDRVEPMREHSERVRTEVPAGLEHAGMNVIAGRGISSGPWGTRWGGGEVGTMMIVGELALSEEDLMCRTGSPSVERAHFERAIRAVRETLDERRTRMDGGVAQQIIAAQLSIVNDPALRTEVLGLIERGSPAPCAIVLAGRALGAKLRASTSRYIRERVGDVEEVCRELVRGVDPALCESGPAKLTRPSVIVATALGVSDLLGLDRELVMGLVLGPVGETSHVAIVARSLRLATIACEQDPVGLLRAMGVVHQETRMMVDAIGEYAVIDPPERAESYAARERGARALLTQSELPIVRSVGRTSDGVMMEVAANVGSAPEAEHAIDAGANSLGLFRTEMLFLDRPHPPSEEEQCAAYSAAVVAAGLKGGVIFRTFDIGADKPAPYLELPREDNPFLGVRGVRLYERLPALIRTQLRAICRASAKGLTQVMAPMVATLEEAKRFVALVREVQGELAAEGLEHDSKMPIGVMVEVPAMAEIVGQLRGVVGFVSIGTNDLAQYLFAADRTSAAVSDLNHPRQPALIRMLDRIIGEARAAGLWVGVCGEMAADPVNLPLLVGMRPDEISVNAGAMGELKSRMRRLDSLRCRELVDQAVRAGSVAEVDAMLRSMPLAAGEGDPLTVETVLIDMPLADKHAVIHALACAMAAAGRAADPRQLERDIWARERTYSTGVGFGVATPHARSRTMSVPTIGVCRLRATISWNGNGVGGEDDGVDLVVMLCVPGAEDESGKAKMDATHQRMLAMLARKLVHEEFREAIRAQGTATEVIAVLRKNLAFG